MEKFSFIIPAYNCEKYIKECLDSIIMGEGNIDYISEILVIDDGSTDNTQKIVKELCKKYEVIKYIYQENSGAPVARNRGINEAKGDYIVFLDSDDMLDNEFFNNLKEINLKNYDLVLGNYTEVDELGKERLKNKEYISNTEITGNEIFKLSCSDPKPGSKIYMKKIIKDNELYFDDLKIGQDTNFFIKYLLFCSKVLTVNKYFYKYRIVNGSISHTYTLKNLKIIETFEYIKKFYSDRDSIEKYEKYIKYAEAQHYYFQFCKLRKYKNYCDRKIIYYTFLKEYKNLKINMKKCISKKNLSYLHKFNFRLNIGVIFTSRLYYAIYNLKG